MATGPFGRETQQRLAGRLPPAHLDAMRQTLAFPPPVVIHCAHWQNRSPWFVPRRRVFDDFCVFVTSGRLLVELEDGKRLLGRGECLLLPEGRPHAFGLAGGDRSVSHVIVHCHAHDLHGGDLLEGLDSPFQTLADPDSVLARLLDCVCLFQDTPAAGMEYARLLLREILLQSARSGRLGERPRGEVDHRIGTALRFIREQYAANIGVTDIAASCGLRQVQFRRLFRHQTGQGPAHALLRQRLLQACRLLSFTDLPVKGIAQDCGFGGGPCFSDVFRRKLGCCPGAYREQTRI
jgi:AraC-like DNA-binding protein